MPTAYIAPEQRFWPKVRKTDTCWQWVGGPAAGRYGLFWLNRRNITAHRWAFESLIGEIPDGKVLDHLCRNTKCVRPDHLEVVTQHENNRRSTSPSARNAMKDRCVAGHSFDAINIYRTPDGRRQCRVCIKRRKEAYLLRRGL